MDKISELQQLLDFVGEQMYISIGHLQENAAPVPLSPNDKLLGKHDAVHLQGVNPNAITELAQSIVRAIKDIDKGISASHSHPPISRLSASEPHQIRFPNATLPGGDEAQERSQEELLAKLEEENRELGQQILDRMAVSETKLEEIRKVLNILAQDRTGPV